MAGYIPKEESQAYTRWRADDFAAPPLPPPAAGSTAVPDLQGAPSAARLPESPDDAASESFHVDQIPLPTAADVERIHDEARQSGYTAGYEEGRQAGHAEGYQAGAASAQSCAEAMLALSRGLQEALASLDQEMAESLLACALEVARQIAHTELRVKPEILLPLIHEALAALPMQHGAVTLFVSPDHLALAQEHLGSQFSQTGWRIQADPEIAPGGCRLRAGNSEVDATLPTRWRRVLEAIGLSPEWLDSHP